MKLFLLIIGLVVLSGCLGGYAGADWRNIFEKQAGQKIEISGYIDGSMGYPAEIFKPGELQGYLLNAQFGKQTTGIPLILKEKITCASNHVKVRGEIEKRGVTPRGQDFLEKLDWIILKVNETECLPV